MRRKIFRSTMTMAMIVLFSSVLLLMGSLYMYFNNTQAQQLRDQLSLAATGAEHGGLDFLSHMASSRFRLTWIRQDGSVIYDSQVSPEEMGNHIDREEFREAMETGRGSSIRTSDTLTKKTMYEAVALSDGTYLRISINRYSTVGLLLELVPELLTIIGVIILLSFHISRRTSKRLVAPINSIDPEHPPDSVSVPEVAPLLRKLHSQNHQIHMHLRELEERAEEFRRISHSMQEGLILTDLQGEIRSINPAAQRIFCGEIHPCSTVQSIDPTGELTKAFSIAGEEGHHTVRTIREDRYYRVDLSRIVTEGIPMGMVLLAIDITESVNAQILRREFSANVSHELKTPLQTILGSTELLENNLVREEDRSRFYGHIRKEATRLLDLVNDILRLSQLEEGVSMTPEPVDLKSLCSECLNDLRSKAVKKHITIEEEIQDATIIGVPRMLREMISNLCQNGILYNIEGGILTLSLRNTPTGTILSVKDTGIGISPEHHEKIFERFYLVDKSHSRAYGGTGLGLSIVKHAAQYHNATIALASTPGQGTEITVTFPTPGRGES